MSEHNIIHAVIEISILATWFVGGWFLVTISRTLADIAQALLAGSRAMRAIHEVTLLLSQEAQNKAASDILESLDIEEDKGH